MSEAVKTIGPQIVLSLDVGTTTIKAIAISKDGIIRGKCQVKVGNTFAECNKHALFMASCWPTWPNYLIFKNNNPSFSPGKYISLQ